MEMRTEQPAPNVGQLVHVSKLHPLVRDLFPTEGSVQWEIRQRKQQYIAGGALFEIAGRLLVWPEVFRRVALEEGARRLAARHRNAPPD